MTGRADMDPRAPPPRRCFLLTRHWRDERDGLALTLWAASDAGPVRVLLTGEQAVCFTPRGMADGMPLLAEGRGCRRELALRTLDGNAAVDGLYFHRQGDLEAAREWLLAHGRKCYESDLKPVDRFLMERFITAAFEVQGPCREQRGFVEYRDPRLRACEFRPPLTTVSLDIETEGLDGALYCIAVAGDADERVFMVAGADPPAFTAGADTAPVQWVADEAAALGALQEWLRRHDPDLILGWNVAGFDLDFLERRARRLGLPFDLGRDGERATVLPAGPGGTRTARVPGRVVLDGIECLRASFRSFESFELEHVARELLGRGKDMRPVQDRVAEIARLYREDRGRLAAYNIEDCRLVRDIFARTGLVEFMRRRAELTGLPMDRMGGSVAAFDHLYLPRLHRRGRVAPDVAGVPAGGNSPGGYVLDSQPGLYHDVLLLDFKSLYPSIIRTFRIDPYGLAAPGQNPVPGFDGASFARECGILPELVTGLWQARDEARRAGDAALSQAVKILMNSFYGVLGASGCRFHDSRLASSITRRGHDIIQRSREQLEQHGHRVIYGDTDSLFVLARQGDDEQAVRADGERMAADLNRWWRDRIAAEFDLESCLEVEFERHFLRFLMPTVRGEQTGSKKRYAGLVRGRDGGHELVFKGLESVRTDWTPLARRFQRELYRRIFLDLPWEELLHTTLAEMLSGGLDHELMYRKRVRRALADYVGNVPPHVQAARKQGGASRWVRYIVTASGPEPVTDDAGLPRPDYTHYRERQLAPAADGILHFLGTSFAAVTDRQIAMF